VATGPSLGFPASLRDELAAANHLMHIAHLEGDVIEMALPVHRVEQEEMMVVARGRGAQEHGAAGITVGDAEAQALHVEILDRFHVGDADDDVAALLWRGALVIGGRLVDATGCAGCVETERLNFELDTLGEAEGDGVAGIIDRVERAAALGADVAVARELFADGIERSFGVDAPGDPAQGRTGFVRRRQVGRIERLDADFGAIHTAIDAIPDAFHTPIVEEACRHRHILDTESDDIDAGDCHAKLLKSLPQTYSAGLP